MILSWDFQLVPDKDPQRMLNFQTLIGSLLEYWNILTRHTGRQWTCRSILHTHTGYSLNSRNTCIHTQSCHRIDDRYACLVWSPNSWNEHTWCDHQRANTWKRILGVSWKISMCSAFTQQPKYVNILCWPKWLKLTNTRCAHRISKASV